MINDSIVEEVHKIRKKLWEDSDKDIQKLIDYFKSCEEKEKDQLFVKKEDMERFIRV